MTKTKNNKNGIPNGKTKPDTNRVLAQIATELITTQPELLDDEYFKNQLASATGLAAAAVLSGRVIFRNQKDREIISYLCALSMVSLIREKLKEEDISRLSIEDKM